MDTDTHPVDLAALVDVLARVIERLVGDPEMLADPPALPDAPRVRHLHAVK